MSNNIYDILSRMPADAPKQEQASQPLVENITAPTKESILAEKLQTFKAQNKGEQQYQTNNPMVRSFLHRAYQEFPNSVNDTEATLALLAKDKQEEDQIDAQQKTWMDQAKSKIDDQQRQMNQMAQVIIDQEKRFNDFNQEVAKMDLTPPEQAQAAVQFAKDPSQSPADVLAKFQSTAGKPATKAEVIPLPIPQQAQEPTATEPEVDEPAEPAERPSAEQPPAQEPAKPATPKRASTKRTVKKPDLKMVKPVAKKTADPLADLGFIDMDQDETPDTLTPDSNVVPIRRVAETTEYKGLIILKEYREGDPNLGLLNFNLLIDAWKKRLPKVDLHFDNQTLTVWKAQIYGLLKEFGRDQNVERRMARVEDSLSYYNNTIQLLQDPKVRKFIMQEYPKFEKNDPMQAPKKELEKAGQLDLFGKRAMKESIQQLQATLMERLANWKKTVAEQQDYQPEQPSPEKVAKHKRLQDLEDKRAEKKQSDPLYPEKLDERELKNKDDFDKNAKTGDYYKTSKGNKVTKTAHGVKHEKAHAKDDDKDDLDEGSTGDYSAKKARAGKDIGKPGKQFAKITKSAEKYGARDPEAVAGSVLKKLRANESDEDGSSSDEEKLQRYHDLINRGMDPDDAEVMVFNDEDDLDEVAPPGAKAERMVKHIKKGYAQDGKLTKKEKGIAYATAWKAHNKGQVEEGVKFDDTIKNSKAELKKAKPAMVKESRMIEESDYTYENIGKSLAEKNPTLNTASSDFVDAVVKEMVAQGFKVNRARNIIRMDEDFLSDVATSYGHHCQKIADEAMEGTGCGMMEEPVMDVTHELDEIARLAGLTREGNAFTGKLAQTAQGGEFELDGKTYKDTSSIEEAEVDEGNEFTQARLDAIKLGKDTFTVAGRTYSVSGDTSDEKAQVAEGIEDGHGRVNISTNADSSGGKSVTVTADGSMADQLIDLLKLSGLNHSDDNPTVVSLRGAEEEVEEEREIQYDNTPDETVAPVDAVTTDAGGGIGGPKKQYPLAANKGANPLDEESAKIKESLWQKYEDMLKDVKA